MEQQSTRFVCDARRLLSTSNPNPLDLPHTYMLPMKNSRKRLATRSPAPAISSEIAGSVAGSVSTALISSWPIHA